MSEATLPLVNIINILPREEALRTRKAKLLLLEEAQPVEETVI